MKNVGVILARLQPIHNGHLSLIRKASNENDEVYVFIGSADKFNERNPIPINIRESLAKAAIEEANLKNVYIRLLDDLSDESDNSHDWGFYLYSKIVTEIQQSNFTIYYSDGFEIITSWFPGFILRNNVSLSLLARNATENGISATQVREYILKDDPELKNVVPTQVYECRSTLKNMIEVSKMKKINIMESFKMSYEDKIKKRQASNMLILNKLSEYIEKYPDLRFGQILINLEILQYGIGGSIIDPWNAESIDILRRIDCK